MPFGVGSAQHSSFQFYGKGQGGGSARAIFLWWFAGFAQKCLNGSDFLGKR
jgi:hypothetical protein